MRDSRVRLVPKSGVLPRGDRLAPVMPVPVSVLGLSHVVLLLIVCVLVRLPPRLLQFAKAA